MRILISAGEASGEMYGAQLMGALRARWPQPALEFFGVGGDRMQAAGCDVVVDARELAVVGIMEILGHLPKIWALFHRLLTEADRRKPDLAIVIDAPAFNWRVARQMKKRGIPVVYYVCPQFWAWRQRRVRLLRKYVDLALVIFPFEEGFFRARGVPARFVGHPLTEVPRPSLSRRDYAHEHALDESRLWITLMPGSRIKEVRMNLPGMLRSAELLESGFEFLLPVAPSLDPAVVKELVSRAPDELRQRIHLVDEARPALAHSRAGVIASGTATVEATLMETPFVMVYRVNPLTYRLGRSLVKVPYFAMVNLIAGTQIVPELVQNDFTGERVRAEINKIVPSGDARQKMLDGLGRVRSLLRGREDGTPPPLARAADAIRDLVAGR